MSGTMKLLLVAGARPNFMKIAPLMKQLGTGDLELLARYVRELAVTGLAERLADNAALVLEPLSPQAARRAAESRLAPREPVFIPEEVTVDGADAEPLDEDGDGYAEDADCDDGDADIHPDAPRGSAQGAGSRAGRV